MQTLAALLIVALAAAWLGWRTLRPILARAGVVQAKGGGCACGDDDCGDSPA